MPASWHPGSRLRSNWRVEFSLVHQSQWWDSATPEQIGGAYTSARAWAGEDVEAVRAEQRIRDELRARYGIDALESAVRQLRETHHRRRARHACNGAAAAQVRPRRDLMSVHRQRWPHPTLPVDGFAVVDPDGENQTCACGNDSATQDWRHADQLGRLTFEASGSDDPAEHPVCPVCGRVYLNAGLFEAGETVAAIARYDVTDPGFLGELAEYDRNAYEGPTFSADQSD